MAYQIRFTDQDKEPIIVEDNTIDQSTSVTFPGRNTTGYGQLTAENFLHLLENFANDTAPSNPIEGQLWYDTTVGVDQLKIYTGTTWTNAGGLKKGTEQPDIANSLPGDLWSNTETQQLYLFTGSSWVLVGPRFSAGAQTGVEPEVIVDTSGVSHSVASMYVDGVRVAIVNNDASNTGFVPRLTIPGFGLSNPIKPGITLNANLNASNAAYIYWGIAEKAQNLLIDGEVVPSDKFVRTDIAGQIIEEDLTVTTALKVGTEAIEISIEGTGDAVISNKSPEGSIDIRVTETGGEPKSAIKIYNDPDNENVFVGIGKEIPEATLDIVGDVRSTGRINITSNTQSTTTATGALIVSGGAGIAGNINLGGNLTMTPASLLTAPNINVELLSPRLNLLGGTDATVGTSASRFKAVYANEIFGTIRGDISNSTGSAQRANRLNTPVTFTMQGDVECTPLTFDGSVSVNAFQTTLSEDFIFNQDELKLTVPEVNNQILLDNDEFVFSRRTSGINTLYKIKKSDVWNQISKTPVGTIVAFAGATAPTGWLLCDGSEVSRSQYSALATILNNAYHNTLPYNAVTNPLGLQGVPGETFRVPDLRGRFGLGLDNMNNGLTVATPGGPVSAGGGNLDRVSGAAADTLGAGSGSETKTLIRDNVPDHTHDLQSEQDVQYYALRNSPTDPGDSSISGPGASLAGQGWYLANSGGMNGIPPTPTAFNVMNPYMAINYIIYTGTDVK